MLTITANDILASTSYVTEILNDLKPIIFMLGGLYVAFYVISKIVEFARLENELGNAPDWDLYSGTDLKFLTWGRKIDEQVGWLEERGFSDETIKTYLEKCSDVRERRLDPNDLTIIEEQYTKKIQKHFDEYGVIDKVFKQ